MFAESLGGVTAQMLTVGLSAATARHQIIAGNIANANSPGYVAREADFSRLFQSAYAQLGGARAQAGWGAMPALPASGTAGGGAVELDVEIAKLSDNTLRYQSLLRGLDRHISNLAYVIADGRK